MAVISHRSLKLCLPGWHNGSPTSECEPKPDWCAARVRDQCAEGFRSRTGQLVMPLCAKVDRPTREFPVNQVAKFRSMTVLDF